HSMSARASKCQQCAVLELAGADEPSLSGEYRHELAVERALGIFDSAERDLLMERDVALDGSRDHRAPRLSRGGAPGIEHLDLAGHVGGHFLCRPVELTQSPIHRCDP